MNASARVIDFDRSVPGRGSGALVPTLKRDATDDTTRPDELFASFSPAIINLRHQIERVAGVDVPVLLLGESGAGKEFAARALHAQSTRASRTFLKINCAALPSELLESELFGYEPGAFTGAVKSKPGLFELCDHGTILLDEIGEMPPALQPKLLQVLQDKQFCRLGGRRLLTVDVRIIAATNIDIAKALEQRTFRTDLYYRLNTITLRVPPLRERREDIPLFIDNFIDRLSVELGCRPRPLSKRAFEACLRHSWPGNVRELKSFIYRHLVLQDDETLTSELLASAAEIQQPDGTKIEASGLKSRVASLRSETERQMIEECLRTSLWNRTETARALRISTKTLWNKMRQYGISDSSRRGDRDHGQCERESFQVDAGAARPINDHRHPVGAGLLDPLEPVGPTEMAKRGTWSAGSGAR
jgi:two-component system, NtrC family, response regulator AtoC